MKSSNQISFCNQPWSNLFLSPNGRIQPCCMNSTYLGNISKNSIDEAWNSEAMQNIRKLVSEKKYSEAGCSLDCSVIYDLKNNFAPSVPKKWKEASQHNTSFNNNIQSFEKNILDKNSFVSNAPITFDIQPNESCNMSCIMCNQNHDSKERVTPDLINKLFINIEAIYSARFQGGEVFIYPKFTQFLIELKKKLSSYQHLTVITNGSAASINELEQLTSGENPVNFIISMDSTDKETYTNIRQTPHFKKVMSSIKYLSKKQLEKDKNILLWSFVVMKSNFYHIEDAIKLANKLNIELRFQPIMGSWSSENIFKYHELRKNDYISYLDKCIDFSLKTKGKISNLETIRDKLA